MSAIPVPSSTVVLVREASSHLEVLLLVRRPKGSDPFSGASVFPGGIVDPADETAVPGIGFDAARARRELGEDLPEPVLRALYVAACRELFEEAGILLALDESGAPAPPEAVVALDPLRPGLQAGDGSLGALLRQQGLQLSLDQLLPYAHWITPENQHRRWNTRFFLATAPPGQTARSDGSETTESRWLRPADALDAYETGEVLLAPPTFRVLEDLVGFSSPAEVAEATRSRGAPPTILPVPLPTALVPTLVYPGDRDYPGASEPGLNRLIMEKGRWRSIR